MTLTRGEKTVALERNQRRIRHIHGNKAFAIRIVHISCPEHGSTLCTGYPWIVVHSIDPLFVQYCPRFVLIRTLPVTYIYIYIYIYIYMLGANYEFVQSMDPYFVCTNHGLRVHVHVRLIFLIFLSVHVHGLHKPAS